MYGNRTMMLLYNIDLQEVAPEFIPIGLNQMVELFHSADRIIVY